MYYLTVRRPDRRMARFHAFMMTPDLFGGVSFLREWGRIGQAGRVVHQHYPVAPDAERRLAHVLEAKRRKGYHLHPRQLALF